MEGKIKEALKYYEKTLSINPNFWTALSNSVSMYSRVGDHNGVLETLKKVIAIKRDYAIRNIGNVNMRFGNYETAQGYYEKDLELGNMFWNLANISYIYRKSMNVEKYLEVSQVFFNYQEIVWISNMEKQLVCGWSRDIRMLQTIPKNHRFL